MPAYFAIPPLVGFLIAISCQSFSDRAVTEYVVSAVSLWCIMLFVALLTTLVAPPVEHWLWTYLWIRVLPALAMPLFAMPMYLIATRAAGLFSLRHWVVLLGAALLIALTNVLAWRIFTQTATRLMLRARAVSVLSTLLFVLFALIADAGLIFTMT